MEYITPKEASQSWGISERRVVALCSGGRVDGAQRLGSKMWVIPKDAPRPLDGRTKAAKAHNNKGANNSMKKLFLASFFKGVAKAFPEFAGGDCNGKKVCFIPTASLTEKVTFYVGADKKALQKLGMVVEDLEITQSPIDVIQDRISQSDYIFVSGGNTFFLLQELRRTGADKLIAEHINSGKVYIGASAGSMVLAGNIEYVKHMDSPADAPDLNGDFTALSITPFSVVPHATNAPFKKAAEKIIAAYGDSVDLRPISNNQAITVTGDDVEIVTV